MIVLKIIVFTCIILFSLFFGMLIGISVYEPIELPVKFNCYYKNYVFGVNFKHYLNDKKLNEVMDIILKMETTDLNELVKYSKEHPFTYKTFKKYVKNYDF